MLVQYWSQSRINDTYFTAECIREAGGTLSKVWSVGKGMVAVVQVCSLIRTPWPCSTQHTLQNKVSDCSLQPTRIREGMMAA